ncbi:MAG: TolC family protein, partial [Pseudomonadota bacterium]
MTRAALGQIVKNQCPIPAICIHSASIAFQRHARNFMNGDPRPAWRLVPRPTTILLAALLSGCAHYAALPLAADPLLAPTIAVLDHPGAALPTGPLSVSDVVDLALANNPELKAARLKRAIAAGQTKQASTLP